MFTEITNRDAWSTIRGFVYQVDMTILRWLDLKKEEILELERGEDIDIVESGISESEASRILEQIKYRESTVSLNTELAMELFFNFFQHQSNNPGKNLLFRFVTNAGFAVERPALFPKGKSGIEVWQEISNSEDILLTDERLTVIKNHLLSKANKMMPVETAESADGEKKEKAEKLRKDWSDFIGLIADPKSLLNFLKKFEWSVQNDDSNSISDKVKMAIRESKHVDKEPEVLYPRLCLFIFKLLTKNGIKQLSITDLQEQCTLPGLTNEENKTFQLITNLLDELNSRVESIEITVKDNQKMLSVLSNDLDLVKSSDAVFNIRLNNISLTPPAFVRNGSLRSDKVKCLVAAFDKYTWINLEGINGTGKTQLALLTAKDFKNVYWIDLRAYNKSEEKSALLIEAMLSSVGKMSPTENRAEWTKRIVMQLPTNCILVLNDLPEITATSPLAELLILLVSKSVDKHISILSTSNFTIPTGLIDRLDGDVFWEYYDLEFSDSEIREVLTNNGAPDPVLGLIDLVVSVCHRNPQILAAIISRLKAINWGTDSLDVMEALFKKEFSADILRDAQLSINKFFGDEEIKDLLYRLSLIHWEYNLNDVRAVCNVETVIKSPYEKLQELASIWIQETGETYKTSPLIHDLGLKNLSDNTSKATYIAIAKSILAAKNIDLVSASRIFSSFHKGGDLNNAGFILLNLYLSAKEKEHAQMLYSWGYLSYWVDLEIPKEMSAVLRVQLSVEQIRLRNLIDKDCASLVARIKAIGEEELEIFEKIFIRFLILSNGLTDNVSEYLSHLSLIINERAGYPDGLIELLTDEVVEGMLWIPLSDLKTQEDVSLWLDLIKKNEKNQNNTSFFSNELSQTGLTILAGNIVVFEKSKTDFRAEGLEARLDYLISYFEKKSLDVLTAVFLKEKIALHIQLIDDEDEALRLALEWQDKLQSLEAHYLLYENLGKLYYNSGKAEKSKEWLEKAIALNCVSQTNFFDTLAYAAAAFSKDDSAKAVGYLSEAVRLIKDISEANELDVIQLLCELGIAHWINNDYQNSYTIFSEALIKLLAIKTKKFGGYWIRMLSWLAHTLGYISAEVSKDTVPEFLRGGSEAYVKPYQGIFLFNVADLSDLYSSNKDILLLAQMAAFAEGVGDLEGSWRWSIRAFDEARKDGGNEIMMMISVACTQYSLVNFKIEEHFEWALQFQAISSHLKGTAQERYSAASQINYEEMLKQRPSEQWDAAEQSVILMSIIPMFIMVLISRNNDDYDERSAKLIDLIAKYSLESSDKSIWDNLHDVIKNIFDRTITSEQLIAESNKYSQADNRQLQIICLLGYICEISNNSEAIVQIINVFPYLTKIFKMTPAIIRNVLVPFVRDFAIMAVNDSFVGTKQELIEIELQMKNDKNLINQAVQKILQPAVDYLELDLKSDRKDWLLNYTEI